jgi:hypothetical protein
MTSALRPPVILVAERSLSADYACVFEGILAGMQTTFIPRWLETRLLAPPLPTRPDGRTYRAPLGLRRMEAVLCAPGGLGPDQVVCTTPEALPRLLGPWVKIVALSSGDPRGFAMSNTTTSAFNPGQLYPRVFTRELLTRLSPARDRWGFKIVFGGPGTWQWFREPQDPLATQIDHFFEGYFEADGPAFFQDLLNDRPRPRRVRAEGSAGPAVRPLLGPATLGAVECSRGCGFGCGFCVMADIPMFHFPPDLILSDLRTNVASGSSTALSTSEDFFRYGGQGPRVNPDAVLDLVGRMRQIPDLKFMQIDHANVRSVLQFSLKDLATIRRQLPGAGASKYLWVNLGVETLNGPLLNEICPGKIGSSTPEEWPHMVDEALNRLVEAGFFPVVSLILGLPGESPDDPGKALAWMRRWRQRPLTVFPIFHEPPGPIPATSPFTLAHMTRDHLALFRECYETNFRWIPRLFWDNQRLSGVGTARRLLYQILGRAEVLLWRLKFGFWHFKCRAG